MVSDDDPGNRALRAMDRLLGEQPHKVGHDFSAAAQAVVAFRESLVAVWRQTQSQVDRDRLAKANAVLSVVVGGHFPLGGVPWGQISKARDQLAELVD